MFFDGNNENMVDRADEEKTVDFTEKKAEMEEKKPLRPAFALWEVDGTTYRMKLSTQDVVELESRYKTNLMNIMGSGDAVMPALKVMLDVAHKALSGYHHGIKQETMYQLFNKYIDEGGSQLKFYMEVYMKIFAASGFFSESQAESMSKMMDKAGEEL